jgi:uncharacterized protein (TIGR02001 family)
MKRILACAVAALGVGAAATPAGAADELIPEGWVPGKFSANVALTSEYFFRGISQTDDGPAIQGGFDWNLESLGALPVGLYAGVWASNIDFNVGNHLEIDLYGGLQGKLPIGEGLGWKLGGIWYMYPNTPRDSSVPAQPTHQDYGELATSLNYDFGLAALTMMYNFAPDYFASTGEGHYLAFKLDIPIWKLTLSPVAGRQWIEENRQFGVPDYWHYGAALTAKIVGFDATVAITDTDISKADCRVTAFSDDVCGTTVYFTVSRTF